MNDEYKRIGKLTDEDRKLYRDRLIRFTILSQKIERENNKKPQKTFEIIYTEGPGSEESQKDISVRISAVTIKGAKKKFELDTANQGLIFKSIREIE